MEAHHSSAAQDPNLPPLPEDERILLLLGLLTSQDRHGYEINDFIEHQLACVTDLKKATAYQLLDRLEQHELITSRAVQHGQRPTRKVYALTGSGHAHFMRLLTAQLREEEPLILPGNVPIMFCEHLPLPERLSALEERIGKLEARLKTYDYLLSKVSLTTGVGLSMERIQAVTQADLVWMKDLLGRWQAEQPQK